MITAIESNHMPALTICADRTKHEVDDSHTRTPGLSFSLSFRPPLLASAPFQPPSHSFPLSRISYPPCPSKRSHSYSRVRQEQVDVQSTRDFTHIPTEYTDMYRLQDQLRDVAVGYADVHVQKTRPRALCEFDGEKWTPIEVVGETQLDELQPQLRQLSVAREDDSAYASTSGSTTDIRSPERRSVSAFSAFSEESKNSYRDNPNGSEDHTQEENGDEHEEYEEHHEDEQIYRVHTEEEGDDDDDDDSTTIVAQGFRRSSAFRLPGLEIEDYEPEGDDLPEDLEDSDEANDVIRDLMVQRQADGQEAVPGETRRPSILASPTYQRHLISFSNLAVSEVDLSEDPVDCDLNISRQHIISAFPKQFEAQARSKELLTSFSVYSRAEEYVEMLHVVLVLESRTVYWKFLGLSDKPVDGVTSLPYCWAADLDLPPLSLDQPKVTDEVECLVMGRRTYSTILCDNHQDECRRCKGLASQDDCFACEGTGIFKKRPCVMCSGNGQYFCTSCKNTGKIPCKTCDSTEGPKPILRQAFVACTRETVVSPTMEVEGDDKAVLISTAKKLARQTIEAEKFEEGTLPVAACGVLIRQRGHIICATDIKTGARGLFEVVPELERVEFKGQLAPITKPASGQSINGQTASIRSGTSQSSTKSKRSSWFGRKQQDEEEDVDDSASIKSTSSRLKNMFKRK